MFLMLFALFTLVLYITSFLILSIGVFIALKLMS
jgi:hypothetical protein